MSQDEVKIAHLKHIFETSHLRQSSIAGLAQTIFRNLILLNGGAIVSIFTIMGHDSEISINEIYIKWAFGSFALGLIFTLLAMGCSFFGQNSIFIDETRNGHEYTFRLLGENPPVEITTRISDIYGFFIIMTFLMSTLATLAFIYGSYYALSSIPTHSGRAPFVKNDAVFKPCLLTHGLAAGPTSKTRTARSVTAP